MLPEYRHITREYMDEDECLDFEIIPSCLMNFDSVEVEERNDASDIMTGQHRWQRKANV